MRLAIILVMLCIHDMLFSGNSAEKLEGTVFEELTGYKLFFPWLVAFFLSFSYLFFIFSRELSIAAIASDTTHRSSTAAAEDKRTKITEGWKMAARVVFICQESLSYEAAVVTNTGQRLPSTHNGWVYERGHRHENDVQFANIISSRSSLQRTSCPISLSLGFHPPNGCYQWPAIGIYIVCQPTQTIDSILLANIHCNE